MMTCKVICMRGDGPSLSPFFVSQYPAAAMTLLQAPCAQLSPFEMYGTSGVGLSFQQLGTGQIVMVKSTGLPVHLLD
jgi:hypothetical protein